MKGIHPEYLLRLRGDIVDRCINDMGVQMNDYATCIEDYKSDKMLKKALKKKSNASRLRNEIDNFDYSTKCKINPKYNNTSSFDIKINNLMTFTYAYKENKAHIYSVGKEFFNLVAGLKRNIPFKYIGDESRPIYIKTPPLTIQGTIYNGAYVFTNMVQDIGYAIVIITPRKNYTVMGCRAVLITNPSGVCNLGEIYKSKDSETNIFSDMLLTPKDSIESQAIWEKERQSFNHWLTGVVNTAVYVNSQDPEIDQLKPLRNYTRKQQVNLGNIKASNLCTLLINLVNWEYYTGRQYTCGEVGVASHMRWQPCGKERSEVKLIWVKEHTRNYNKSELQNDNR